MQKDLTFDAGAVAACSGMRFYPTSGYAPILDNWRNGPILTGSSGSGLSMIDAEVMRLRRLRDVALWTRAVAGELDMNRRRTSMFARAARVSWTIARITSGRLRAHPYLSFQQDASRVRAVIDGLGASLIGRIARRRGRTLSTCLEQMEVMARELDDTRALTWSPDLSDTLGRMQFQVRQLLVELNASARHEMGVPAITQPATTELSPADWPYIAI